MYTQVSNWQKSPAVQAMQSDGRMAPLSEAQALNNFRKGLEKGAFCSSINENYDKLYQLAKGTFFMPPSPPPS